jgi:hypothetical protein
MALNFSAFRAASATLSPTKHASFGPSSASSFDAPGANFLVKAGTATTCNLSPWSQQQVYIFKLLQLAFCLGAITFVLTAAIHKYAGTYAYGMGS